MKEEILKKSYKFAQNYHLKDTSGHDFEHIKRVYANACSLLEKTPHANAFVVKMSALLHDIDDHKFKTEGKNASKFLQSIKLNQQLIDEILSTIDAIGFAKSGPNPKFDTIEMKLLYDADKLDAIGAIGICRAIMFGTWSERPLFDADIFPTENLSKEEYKNLTRKGNNSINHFFDKLLKLKDAMQTETGKQEALKRHDFMLAFLRQFFEEQNLIEWQKYLDNYLIHMV